MVSTIHGYTNTSRFSKLALYEWLDLRLLPYKDAIVFVNPSMKENVRFSSLCSGGENLYTVNNGISASDEPSEPLADEQRHLLEKFTGNSYVLLSIGRLSEEKGFGYLLRALAMLKGQSGNIRLILAGDGPLSAELKSQAKQLDIIDRVYFCGYMENARCLMSYSDLYVISSLTEGLPITLLEAMRGKLPVMATSVGGIPTVLKDQVNGRLIESENVAALATGIQQTYENRDECKKFADTAFKDFNEHYTSEKMELSYREIYKKTVAR